MMRRMSICTCGVESKRTMFFVCAETLMSVSWRDLAGERRENIGDWGKEWTWCGVEACPYWAEPPRFAPAMRFACSLDTMLW